MASGIVVVCSDEDMQKVVLGMEVNLTVIEVDYLKKTIRLAYPEEQNE